MSRTSVVIPGSCTGTEVAVSPESLSLASRH
ncbi:Uncharacterised protein [Mycobacteroides abscessus subsp. abscessus]|nr:Uncharacterised protein [Mycobacteroides abscessus subsp. abscessus]